MGIAPSEDGGSSLSADVAARRIGCVAIVRDTSPGTRCWSRARGRAARAPGVRARALPAAVELPASCTPTCAPRSRRRGIDFLWSHQAEALESAWEQTTIVTTGTASGKSLVLPAADARAALARLARPGAVPVSVEGARAGPGARAARASGVKRMRAGDLRRRHAARAARRPAPAGQPGPHQPRHAARRDPAQPRGVGGLLPQPRGRRGRRGARLPRHLRLARGQRPAAAAADLRAARHRAALPAGVGDGRQPGRAGRAADRARRRARDLARRLAGHEAHDRDVEPADDRRGDRRAPLGRWPRPPTCSSSS